jgi:hypothetical protein
MGISTVNSPNNSTGREPVRGISPGCRSNPDGPGRADSGHRSHYVGKGYAPHKRPDSTPIQGGYRSPVDDCNRR